VGAALKAGIPVSYTDNPLLSASLPTDLKVNLKDYNPQTDAMCALLWDAYKAQSLRELVGEGDGDYLKEGREELLEALRERERKYGYKAPLNANLTKPSRWENVPDDEFADPVGYKYPVHTPRNARAASQFLVALWLAAFGMTTEGNAAIDLNDENGNQRVTVQVNNDGLVTVMCLRG